MKLLEECVARTEASLGSNAVKKSVLAKLLVGTDDEGRHLKREEVLDNMLTFIVAAYDTTSSAMTSILFQLDRHPRVMATLRQEQQQLVAKHGSDIKLDTLKQMSYAEAVIRENFRCSPTVPMTIRTALHDFNLGGFLVKKQQPLVVALAHIVGQDRQWQQQEGDMAASAFNPDRWLTPEVQLNSNNMAFGAGHRVCAGLPLALTEMKVFMAVLARKYELHVQGDVEWEVLPVPWPKDGMPAVVFEV